MVAVADGQGVGDTPVTAVAVGLAEELGDALGVGLVLVVALAEVDGVVPAAGAQMLGATGGASSV